MTGKPSHCVASALAATFLATVSGMAMTAPAIAQEQPAVTALVRQGEFWRGRGRKDLAAAALQKALAASPRNPDVLAALARFAAEDGDRAAAERWTGQLRAIAPNDARIAALASVQKATPPEAGLAQARRLAQSGSLPEAIAAYRSVFGAQTPPEAYRLEYYQTLAGSPATWDEGREGLQKLIAAKPDDPAVKLAYAQTLTYREPTRREGISRLAALRGAPAAISGPAARAWRQALIWLGARPADRPLYQAFLAASPADAEVSAKLAQIDANAQKAEAQAAAPASPADRGSDLRQAGFAALDRGADAEAQQKFEAALRLRANDADALGGLGLVKLRAQDFAGARTLLQRAVDAAPASRARWQEALASARFFSDFRAAQAAGGKGDWAQAEALARPLADKPGPDQPIAQQLLADALAHENRPADAEALYRKILAAKPGQADARTGLMDALLAEGRFAEAEALGDTPADRTALGAARGRIELARANQLWSAGDASGANTAFEQALAAQPADPWTRYDFARFLDEQGQGAAADGLISPLPAAGTPESLQVAALFAQRRNHAADAFALISQVPQAQRTADMTRLLGELRISAEVEQADAARRAGRTVEALSALRGILAQPGLTVGAQSQIASALYDLGDGAEALALAQQALMQSDKQDPAAYTGFVAVLARAGRDAEASALIRQLAAQPGAANPGPRRALAGLAITLGAERADRLRLAGDLAGAFDTLSSTFALAPNDARLLGALARLYQGGGMPDRAGAVFEQLLRLNPNDQDALIGVAQAAVARKDWNKARLTLNQAMARSPNDPNLYVLSASIEQGAGDRRAALRALATAKTLRERQFAYASGAPGLVPGLPSAVPGAGVLGPNPFAGGPSLLQPQRQELPSAIAAAPMAALLSSPGQARFQPAAWSPPLPPAGPAPATPGFAPAPPAYTPPASSYAAPPPAQQTAAPLPPAPAFADPLSALGQPFPQTVAQAAPPPAPAANNPFGAAPRADPLLAAIDQRIASIGADARPSVQAQIGFRGRSGEAGLSRLSDLDATVALNVPAASGKLTVSLKPVTLDAGVASGDSLQRVGGNPLLLAADLANARTPVLHAPGVQSASGAGVDIAYERGAVAADVETTPLGFGAVQAGGGLSWSPRLWTNGVAKLWVERRVVTDSLTSYAGVRDDVSGIRWGQVMRSTAGISLSYDVGKSGVYTDFADSDYHGRHTAKNSSYQFNIGAYIRPIQHGAEQLQVGANLNHQGYDNNQNFFTVGQGGYFSPKSFTSVSLPIDYKNTTGPWMFDLYAAPGYQTYVEASSLYFPVDPALQGALDVLSTFNALVPRVFAGTSQSGFGMLARAKAEYAFMPNLAVGGLLSFNNFGTYRETQVGLYVRQLLGGTL